MKLLNFFRKPFLSYIAGFMLLFVSCKQYELNNEKHFTYSLYKIFKENNVKLTQFNLNTKNLGQNILLEINNKYGSDLAIPDHIINAMFTKTNINDVISFVEDEGLLSNQDVVDLVNFANKVKTDNFDSAIKEFEVNIKNRNLSEIEFEKYDNIASIFKITNDQFPTMFNNSNRSIIG